MTDDPVQGLVVPPALQEAWVAAREEVLREDEALYEGEGRWQRMGDLLALPPWDGAEAQEARGLVDALDELERRQSEMLERLGVMPQLESALELAAAVDLLAGLIADWRQRLCRRLEGQ